MENKMYITETERKEKGLPTMEEQIARWNRLQEMIAAEKSAAAKGGR
jgi:hypothetical protein